MRRHFYHGRLSLKSFVTRLKMLLVTGFYFKCRTRVCYHSWKGSSSESWLLLNLVFGVFLPFSRTKQHLVHQALREMKSGFIFLCATEANRIIIWEMSDSSSCIMSQIGSYQFVICLQYASVFCGFFCVFYRPQLSCGKVMFLHLSVSHSVHRGGVWQTSTPE